MASGQAGFVVNGAKNPGRRGSVMSFLALATGNAGELCQRLLEEN